MSAIQLYNSQRRWKADTAKFKAAMFARQIGKTFSSTLEIVDDCLDAEVNGSRRRWVILSRGERQAKEAINEGVKVHLAAYAAAFDAYEVPWEGTTENALEVRLPNGSKITAVPANPDTARGFTASVLLDEFAFHPDSRKIWGALFPVVSRGDLKLRVISTPNGKGNKFYEIMTAGGLEDELRSAGFANAGVWNLYFCDIYRAVAEGLERDIETLKAGLGDDDLWEQEFELKWLDEATAWLDYELINAAENDKAGIPEHYTGGLCYAGVDIGRRRDLFVIWVDEMLADVAWCRQIIARRRVTFREQDQLLDEVMRKFRIARLCADQTGMGEKPVEDWKRKYGEYMVEGVLFTSPTKLHLATIGKQSFEDRRSRIPLGNRDLRSDLHSLRKLTTAAGNVRFDADRSDNGHADRAWAKFLATHAAEQPYQAYDYQPATAASLRRDDRQLGAMLEDELDDDYRGVISTAGFGRRGGIF